MSKVTFWLVLGLLARGGVEATCWDQASKRYGIPTRLLKAIAKQAINHNKNGTYDIGLMQVNSFWIPKLKKFHIEKEDLFRPCTNLMVGAWILAQSIKSYGHNWRAVGAYNVGTRKSIYHEQLREQYAQRIYRHYLSAKL